MKAKVDPPTEFEDPRADKPEPRRDRRRRDKQAPDTPSSEPATHPVEGRSWRNRLPAELRNVTPEELTAALERNICQLTAVKDPTVANRFIGQSALMRTFGEPDGCNSGDPEDEGFAWLDQFASNNIMESMLAVQMSGVHEAALAFLRAAGKPGLSQRERDAEVRRAKQLLQLFNSQVESMTKLKNQGWDKRGPAGTTTPD